LLGVRKKPEASKLEAAKEETTKLEIVKDEVKA